MRQQAAKVKQEKAKEAAVKITNGPKWKAPAQTGLK